jgi:AcrR family transcriptional regulator
MDDAAFDAALIAAAFQLAAEQGWRHVSVVAAARAAGLPLGRARERFAGRAAILVRLGRRADQAALAEAPSEGPVRDRLFDLLMRRIDTLQTHRAGVLALLSALPADPPTALLLALATRRSMRWMLEAAGIPTRGIHGELRVKGLLAVWLWTLRAWRADDGEDLGTTMAALDAALRRAEQAAGWLGWRPPEAEPPADAGEPEQPPPEAPA